MPTRGCVHGDRRDKRRVELLDGVQQGRSWIAGHEMRAVGMRGIDGPVKSFAGGCVQLAQHVTHGKAGVDSNVQVGDRSQA